MVDTNRRNFLQLLGIGAAASIVPVPLFASEDTSIWTPNKNLLSGHLVLTRPKAHVAPGGVTRAGVQAVGGRIKWPKVRGQVFRVPGKAEFSEVTNVSGAYVRRSATRSWNESENEVDLVMVDDFGEEPHIDVLHTEKTEATLAFYQASMQLRDNFKEDSLALLQKVPEYQRQGLQIVTLVNAPIFVGPLDWAEWRDYMDPSNEEPPPGFRVSMDYVQYLVRGELDTNGWVEESVTGQYPLESAYCLDWDHIYQLDKKLILGDLSPVSVRKRTRLILS